eukprot:Tbor_TRINITY_DN6212_c2_g1::TRINITY_DN6212_c2_g1_i5::g.1874::m.1874
MLKKTTVNTLEAEYVPIDGPIQTNDPHTVESFSTSEPSGGNVRHGNKRKHIAPHHVFSEDNLDISDTYEAGFITQLTATLRRQIIQKTRMPCSLFLEFMLPIAAISVFVFTSAPHQTDTYESMQFVNSTPSASQPFDPMAKFVSTYMCYNNSIPGYNTPQDVKDLLSDCRASINPICAPDDQLLEGIRGICVSGEFGISSITAKDTEVRIPSFDHMVLVQWAARALPLEVPKVLTDPFFSLQINGILYFYPNNDAVKNLVDKMKYSHKLFKYVYGGTHGSRDEIINKIKYSKEGNTWAIVGIESANPADLVIELSLNRSAVPFTSRVRPIVPKGGEGESQYTYYYTSGFLTLQKDLLGKYYPEIEALGASPASPTVTTVPMGYAKWESNMFLSYVGVIAPLVMVLAFLYTVAQ